MRKILLLTLGFCLVCININADEQKKISLSNDHSQETVSLGYCNIFATLKNTGDDSSAEVAIELENLDESKVLILFDQAYSEKSIKKLRTSIRFDKKFGGTKNKRVIDPYNNPMNAVMLIEPSDKQSLPNVTVSNEEGAKCRMPIYIAKFKGKKKLILLEKQVIELDIDAELKPSKEYLSLSTDCEKLENELKRVVICTNPKHKTSVSKQKESYEKRIDALKERIDNAIAAHNWTAGDGGYKRYNALKERLDNANFREGDCGRHGRVREGHTCSYCSLSLQQIYHKLDDFYKKIYSSNNRKEAKASVMSQVNALYQCCTDPTCSKHASAWKKGGDYKTKIIERYNRIKNL